MDDRRPRTQNIVTPEPISAEPERSEVAPAVSATRLHRQLLAACPECAAEWEQLGLLQETFEARLADLRLELAPEAPDDDLLADAVALGESDDRVAVFRHLRRRAYEQLWTLKRLPPARRPAKIRGAFRQFQGRALAQLLIEESRSIVRSKPAEAAGWAELVPLVLDWARGDGGPPWAAELLVRAEAHRANALRIWGDLTAADAIFVRLRATVAALPLPRPSLVAEIASLEASLRIGQHRLLQAEDLLDRASRAYQQANDSLGLARVRIKQANVAWDQGRAAQMLRLFEDASLALEAATDTPDLHLVLCTVTGRVLALCELERFGEADALLRAHQDPYEASDDPYAAAMLRGLQGRVALGLGGFDRAEESYTSCRDAYLALGRYHDAALACLDLAETLHAAGRVDDLLALASQLVPLFRSKKLPVETFRALDHLVKAIRARRLSAARLAERRRALPGSRAASAFASA
jgi:tetratricopeptide (TPR) repeat protein